ncbi:hypothetical protein MVES1_003251 [Malassezia vespertilionis]|uniref:DUF3533 domain-containing protein n=1 Tax=Malassezia vespertilionis TaxID=2020962 RepID=A0A2N1J9E4_9BASI|nr:uncharacterized protein MVES1_003251 [Malassezia vespertilionis]PKI83173.1 hypothetical protein MVES_003088 [Malassezia vespertilionis]WFD07883.1 hypothetical protein MVES1_003251 [Malassezia vespertilionis]
MSQGAKGMPAYILEPSNAPHDTSNPSSAYYEAEKSDAAAQQPTPQLCSHGFWDPELKSLRVSYLKPAVMVTVSMMVVVWAMMAIYWGSLWKENDFSTRQEALVVNLDNGIIGQTITDALLQTNQSPVRPRPTYVLGDPNMYKDRSTTANTIEPQQTYWLAVEIAEGATDRLTTARMQGNASYDGTELIRLTISSARSYSTVPSTVLIPTQNVLQQAIAGLSKRLSTEFLQQATQQPSLLQAALRAPQTLSQPVGFTVDDLAPWDIPVAIAPTFVGLIYLTIMTLQVTMALFAARQGIQKYLTFRSMLAVRTLTPVLAYIPISLMITLLNIPFGIPFGRTFSTYGEGVMVWWSVSYVGMLVCGMCLESVITILGPPFIGLFLILFIITNVSVSNLPIPLSVSFFKYGYAMPFYNIRQMYLSIIFHTGKHILILKYMGILWAWLALIALTFPLFVYIDYLRRRKVYHHERKPELVAA